MNAFFAAVERRDIRQWHAQALAREAGLHHLDRYHFWEWTPAGRVILNLHEAGSSDILENCCTPRNGFQL